MLHDYVPSFVLSFPVVVMSIYFWDRKRRNVTHTTTPHSTLGIEAKKPPPDLYKETSSLPIFDVDYRHRKSVLSKLEIERLAQEGYVVLRNMFTAETIEECLEIIGGICREEFGQFNTLVEECMQKVQAGEIHMSNGGLNQILQFEPQAKETERGKRSQYVRKIGGYHESFPKLALYKHPVLKALVNQILEVSETEVFQSLGLLKPPMFGREKPFHQDHSYFNVKMEPCANGLPTKVVGIWAALDRATAENGCMHVIPRNHRKPWKHFMVRDWQICDTEIKDVLSVPMNPGDVLLFSSLLPHGTPPNLSHHTRRALQFHLIPKDYPRTNSTRVQTFGGEFGGLQC